MLRQRALGLQSSVNLVFDISDCTRHLVRRMQYAVRFSQDNVEYTKAQHWVSLLTGLLSECAQGYQRNQDFLVVSASWIVRQMWRRHCHGGDDGVLFWAKPHFCRASDSR